MYNNLRTLALLLTLAALCSCRVSVKVEKNKHQDSALNTPINFEQMKTEADSAGAQLQEAARQADGK